jgi:beta-galactosidase/beta-glucuronidase
MLVWNDFWITTDDTVEPNDQPLFMRNATDVVRRFRNHPSIAIWCPRHEGYAPKGLAQPLAEMLAREDPTRHYHGQSRYLNMRTSGPWSYFEDP